jgi:hypothetical protein
MSQAYSTLPAVGALDESPPNDLKRSLSISSGSDISYADPLDEEPFSEKGDSRFQDEPRLEDGDESSGFVSGTRRVSSTLSIW